MLLFLYSERISMFQAVVFCQESVNIVPLGQGSFSPFTFYCPLDYDFCKLQPLLLTCVPPATAQCPAYSKYTSKYLLNKWVSLVYMFVISIMMFLPQFTKMAYWRLRIMINLLY